MNRVLQSITAIFAGATLAAALPCGTASAQNLGEAEISTLRASFENTGSTRALQNVLTHDSNIKENAANFSNEGKLDHFFKYRADVKGITDQKSSGRCWMFTSMNALRPAVMQKYNLGEFDFSHNYNYFWDILEKSNLFLENILATIEKPMDDRTVVFLFKSPVDDGGVWNSFYNIATKYGVVPQSVMPETAHSNNTAQLGSIINERLRAGGYELRQLAEKREADLSRIQGERDIAKSKAILAESIRIKKLSILKDIYRVLALCLGEPPTEFTWRYKDKNGDIKELKSTPLEFFKSIEPAGYTPEEYIMTMNDPTREYYKVYEIENYRNTMEGINWKYLNLPNEELKSAALAESALGNREQRLLIVDHRASDHEITLRKRDSLDSARRASHRSDFILAESRRHSVMSCDNDIFIAGRVLYILKLVALIERDRDLSALALIFKL